MIIVSLHPHRRTGHPEIQGGSSFVKNTKNDFFLGGGGLNLWGWCAYDTISTSIRPSKL